MRVKILLSILVYLLLYVSVANAAIRERVYQDKWCKAKGGQSEVVMPDRSRADCILPDYAIEFDFCRKWAESIGQSLNYATMTGKRPMVVLICNPATQSRYINRFNNAVKYLNRYEKPILIVIPK